MGSSQSVESLKRHKQKMTKRCFIGAASPNNYRHQIRCQFNCTQWDKLEYIKNFKPRQSIYELRPLLRFYLFKVFCLLLVRVYADRFESITILVLLVEIYSKVTILLVITKSKFRTRSFFSKLGKWAYLLKG
jgi:hypothetical protein